MAHYKKTGTALIHGGIYGDKVTGAVNTPIYQTSTYEQHGLGENTGWEYSRTGNPTRAALEALIAELEGGTAGFAFGSGMAAITAVLTLFKTGDKVIISSNVYGGTFRVLDKVFKNFNLSYEIVDTSDLALLEKSISSASDCHRPGSRGKYREKSRNPVHRGQHLHDALSPAADSAGCGHRRSQRHKIPRRAQ